MNILLIALGGGIGSVCRYSVNRLIATYVVTTLPWATFIVNLVGSFLIGALAFGLTHRIVHHEAYRLLLITGFLGGLTTFSSFSLDTLHLWLNATALVSQLAMRC